MKRYGLFLLVVVVAVIASVGASLQEAPSAPSSAPLAVSSLTVPEGNGAPVITDGIFSAGEWDDALQVPLHGSVTLLVKEYRGVVFIGIRGRGQAGIGPSELFLSTPGGAIHKMHVSAQLYEAELPAFGEAPPPRFGFTTDWYANETRRDELAYQRMLTDGRNEQEALKAATHSSEGREYAIRRFKVPGSVWLLRLSASVDIASTPHTITYPPFTPERPTTGWQELRLK